MQDIRLRPRFRRELACTPDTFSAALKRALTEHSGSVVGNVYKAACVLKISAEEAHFWSPQLHLSIENETPGTVLHGLFGPRPSIWSIFVALYAALLFLGSMGMIFGFSQWTLGGSGMLMWTGPAALVLAGVIYAVGRTGRRLGMDQMVQLRDFVDRRIEECGG